MKELKNMNKLNKISQIGFIVGQCGIGKSANSVFISEKVVVLYKKANKCKKSKSFRKKFG